MLCVRLELFMLSVFCVRLVWFGLCCLCRLCYVCCIVCVACDVCVVCCLCNLEFVLIMRFVLYMMLVCLC